MPRRHTILQSTFPYSVTARSNNKEWFDLPVGRCWEIYERVIAETSVRYGTRTHCFVLMSNHFHWLISTPNANLGLAMRFFMTETSRGIARSSGRINKIYGSRYRSSLLSNAVYYSNTVRYFYQNPLRAKICKTVDEYPWSTRRAHSRIQLSPCVPFDEHLPIGADELTQWLNKIPPGPYQLIMQKALRRSEFKFPRHPTTKREIDGQNFLI